MVQLNEFISYFDIPHKMMGLEFGARMSLIKLQNGVVLHSPIPVTAQQKEAISKVGEVKYIVAPNKYHHVFLQDAQKSFPSAKTLGAPGLSKKRLDIQFEAELPAGEFSTELKPY